MRNILNLILLLCASQLTAQNFSISGQLMDVEDNTPLTGAHIILSQPWGELVKATTSDADGKFLLEEIPRGGYKIKMEFLGYKTHVQEVTLSTENVIIEPIKLGKGSLEIDEISVTATVPLAQQKGDTTEYNADAFKTLNDASTEDLIEKMPGVVILDGKVQAQGEDVKQILVDGKPFFGSDPNAAIKNLPAEVVDKIQVYDQSSEQTKFTGFEDGETSKTINIITRKEFRKGQFGKVYGGYGASGLGAESEYGHQYKAGGNASLFNGQRRISIIAQSNNINEQNFATDDILGVVGSSGRRGRGGRGKGGGGKGGGRGGWGGGGSVNDFLVQQMGGVATTHAAGINYSDMWTKKVDVTGSYFFNYSDNSENENLNRQYVDAEGVGEYYEQNSQSRGVNMNHRANMRIDWKIDSVNSLMIRPRLSMQMNNGTSTTFGQTSLEALLLNLTNNSYDSDLSGMDFSNTLLFRHKFKKRSRTISFNARSGYKYSKGSSLLQSNDLYYSDLDTTNSVLDQFSDLDVSGWNVSGSLNYTEPLGKFSMLMFDVKSSLQEDISDKQTFDYQESTEDYSEMNTQLTNVFKNQYMTHKAGLAYNYRKGRNFIVMARAHAQLAQLNSDQSVPVDYTVNRNYYSFLPMAMMRISFDKKENLRIFYMGRTQNPNVEQLQNVVDNSNPLQLSVGNTDLDQSYSHRLYARYSKTSTDKAYILYLMGGFSYTKNYIGNSTYLTRSDNPIFNDLSLEQGAQLIQPVNLDGYWNSRAYFTYGVPVSKIKTNINTDLSFDYTLLPGLIDDRLNKAHNKSLGIGITFSSNISENLDFTLSTRSNLNKVDNTVQESMNSQYLNQRSKLKFGWVLPYGIVLRTNLEHRYYLGYSEDVDPSFFLWQAGIGKKLFKNQRGEITLTVFDILNENQSFKRNVTDAYIEDVQTNVLQQYLMLTFTYNFRNFRIGKEDFKEKEKKRDFFWH